jgi:hypothetical protein
MAILRASEGIRINSNFNTNTGWGSRTWHLYRTIFGDGTNFIQFTQSGTVTYRTTVSVILRWGTVRTDGPRVELPGLYAFGTFYLNRNGSISNRGLTWIANGGNGINFPYQVQGGSSVFIGANRASTNTYSGVVITVSTMGWNNLIANPFND